MSSEKLSIIHSCMKALVNRLLIPPPDGKLLHKLPACPPTPNHFCCWNLKLIYMVHNKSYVEKWQLVKVAQQIFLSCTLLWNDMSFLSGSSSFILKGGKFLQGKILPQHLAKEYMNRFSIISNFYCWHNWMCVLVWPPHLFGTPEAEYGFSFPRFIRNTSFFK